MVEVAEEVATEVVAAAVVVGATVAGASEEVATEVAEEVTATISASVVEDGTIEEVVEDEVELVALLGSTASTPAAVVVEAAAGADSTSFLETSTVGWAALAVLVDCLTKTAVLRVLVLVGHWVMVSVTVVVVHWVT